MPLQWQNTAIPFGRGVDTKTDPKLVAAPFLSRLENGVFTSGGSIIKRNGYRQLPTRVTGSFDDIQSGEALATHKGELLLFDGARAYAYSPANAEWIDKGATSCAIPATRQLVRNNYSQSVLDSAYSGSVCCAAYADSRGGLRVQVRDSITGTPYLADVALGAGTGARVVTDAAGLYFYVFRADGTSLFVHRIACRSPTTIAAATVPVTDRRAGGPFDVARSGTSFLVAYATTDGLKRCFVTPAGLLGATLNGYPDPIVIFPDGSGTIVSAVSVRVDADYVYVAIGTTAPSAVVGLQRSPLGYSDEVGGAYALTGGALVANVALTQVADGSFRVFYEQTVGSPVTARQVLSLSVPASLTPFPTTPTPVARRCGLASQAFARAGQAYALLVLDSAVQPTYLLSTDGGRLVSKHSSQNAGGVLPVGGPLPSASPLGGDTYAIAGTQRTRLQSENGQVFTTTGAMEMVWSFARSTRYATAELGNNLYILGGQVLLYDGRQLVEDGYVHYPEGVVATPATGEGGAMANGTRLYKAAYAWSDASGQIHRSATSRPVSVTFAAGGTAQSAHLTVKTLALTNKTDVFVEIYRTIDNGTNYYLVTSPTAPLLNTTGESVAFHDLLSDTQISSRAILYTTGGELDNDSPPAMRHIMTTKQRLFGIPAEAPDTLWYTKEFDGSSGVGWSAALQQRAPALGGELELLAALDDKVVALKANKMFAMSGDGPTPNGLQDTFSPLQLINSDCGATDGDSLVDTSDGLIFKSAKGIRLLDRSLAVQDIGGPVAAYNGQDVSSAVLLEDSNQIRFTASEGPALCYDYYWKAEFSGTGVGVGQWSTFTDHAATDAVLWKSLAAETGNLSASYCYLRRDGRVMQETPGAYTDAGRFYPLLVETAWLPFAGNQGYFRCRRALLLGTFYSDHVLRVRLAYSYGDISQDLQWSTEKGIAIDTYGKSDPYGSDTTYGGRTEAVYQVRIDCRPQKCQALKLQFSDSPLQPATAGKAYSLSGLAFEIGGKKGLHKTGLAKFATR